MASREKRPLAPSKSKQKANNNDSGLPSSPSKTKKGKTLPAYILEAVATGSNKLSPKLETTLPRKRGCLTGLKCKKLRQTKGNLLKVVKTTQKIPVKNLKRLAAAGSTKTAKKILNRTKKSKNLTKQVDVDLDSVPLSELITDTATFNPKSSLKASRRLKSVSPESKTKGKTLKKSKEEVGFDINKYLKQRKSNLGNKNSIDLTIDEVCAMHSDTEMDETERIKLKRSKKMLLDESEIKKELIDDDEQKSDDENISEISPDDSGTQSKKRTNTRSLRNGKLRPLDTTNDAELKRNRRLAMEDTTASESGAENTPNDTESCISESSATETSSSMSIKDEGVEKLVDATDTGLLEPENNNNSSERVGGSGDAGPNLRSKTKAKSTDTQMKIDDNDVEEMKIIQLKSVEEAKKSSSVDQLRKDCLLGKVTSDKQPIKRRSSLNIDVKKTMGSLYGNEKCDGTTAPTSQIDQMIENIKLTIAKSIEIKFLGPDKGLSLGKNFDVPKIEEIVAPLSTETKIDSTEENNKPNVSNCETESTNSSLIGENSVPKVADTAKEIEKLVMGDIVTSLETKQQEQTTSKDTINMVIDQNIQQLNDNKIEKIQSRPVSAASQSCSTDDKDQDKPASRSESRTDNKEEAPMKTDESETLETISEEVERLVTETTVEITSETSQSSELLKINNDESTIIDEKITIDSFEDTEIKIDNITQPIIEVSTCEALVDEDNNVNDNKPDDLMKQLVESTVDIQAGQSDNTKNITDKTLIVENEEIKLKDDKINIEETKSIVEESRRVLRARDKQKKIIEKSSPKALESPETSTKSESDTSRTEIIVEETTETMEIKSTNEETVVVKIEETEPQTRTRRSRDVKKRKEETSPVLKTKRNRRETKKIEQQNKEETLLDNEVAKINENKRSFTQDKFSKRLEGTESLRVFSQEQNQRTKNDNRSKSENDIESAVAKTDRRISRGRCETDEPKETENPVEIVSDIDNKIKTPENLRKDSDEASTSGESTSSVSLKLLETPEDKAEKESILRMLGLESLEKAAERLNQKARREQYTGTLKTVIRVQKDKKRSRSPLKLVFNRQGRTDGEGVSPEFYTIQKEVRNY